MSHCLSGGTLRFGRKLSRGAAPLLALLAGTLLLAGCNLGDYGHTVEVEPVSPIVPPPYAGPTIAVRVLAGQAAIAGAAVQLYAAGTTGNGSTPTTLLAGAVTTDSNGMAAVPANYTCPSSASLVYLRAQGGTISGVTGANAGISLATAIGPCGGLTAGATEVVNEVTTVAAMYALQPFYASGGFGASATNLTGITNAFATANVLANPATGTAPGATLPANASSPAMRVNSVANALHACLVQTSACTALYSAATAAGTAPTNTLDGVASLTRSPGANVAGVYAEAQMSTAFSPALGSAPSDWTMFLNLTGGGLNSPAVLALDSKGSVWVANYFGVASKFGPDGTPVFAAGVTGYGLNNSYGLAVDLSDNVWIANQQPARGDGSIGSVTVLTSAGAAVSGANGYVAGGFDFPLSIAIDPNGTSWVVDYGNSHLTLLNAAGVPLSGASGYTSDKFAFPVVVALDGNHYGWLGNQANATITKVAPDGSSFTNVTCCGGASGLAIDQGNNVWTANYYADSVSLITNSGTVVSSGFRGQGSLYHPQGIAIDGAGTVWVANYRGGTVTELAGTTSAGSTPVAPGTTLSPTQGYGVDAQLVTPYALAVDASGNVWTSNQGSDSVTKFIGVATPVKTPLSGLPKAP